MAPKKADEGEQKGAARFGRVKNNLKMGLLGLPNVGKSSLFNLLTEQVWQLQQQQQLLRAKLERLPSWPLHLPYFLTIQTLLQSIAAENYPFCVSVQQLHLHSCPTHNPGPCVHAPVVHSCSLFATAFFAVATCFI
jgi:GTPase SAR1 family protein